MPILKQSSSHAKKRTRIDREMISAPLGDFRHTMHVGRGGDVFGDTSFLSNHGPASAPPVEVPTSKKNGHLKLTGDHEENKTSDSLSHLSQSSGIGSGAGSISSSPVNHAPSKEDSLWNSSNSGCHSDQVDWLPLDCGLKHAESILSFHFDLGPSFLDDVLGVMDRDAPSDWNSPDDQCDYKFSAESSKLTQLSSITESPGSHYSLSTTLPVTNPTLEYSSNVLYDNLEGNQSAYEGDSEEEKRSIYEGVADTPAQNENHFHTIHYEELDEEEEVGQGYTFEEDLDDEIGV
ncbi:PREDICTED: cdc42 effector protein 4-like [Nanorana parkeri]|uniref:cdc42 effector protein 4-like n=1 Tax=Nanorana parkeri TaxID=125878 RepID=UPI0008541CE3|nr:PREDICTED: cdc42 effector protein 4-like [Nanorana parkeri]